MVSKTPQAEPESTANAEVQRISIEQVTGALLRQLFVAAAAVLVVLAVLASVLTVRAIAVQQNVQEESFDALGTVSTKSLARMSHPYLLLEDEEQLQKLVVDAQKETQDGRYAAIVSRDGTVVASSPTDYRPTEETLVTPADTIAVDVA